MFMEIPEMNGESHTCAAGPDSGQPVKMSDGNIPLKKGAANCGHHVMRVQWWCSSLYSYNTVCRSYITFLFCLFSIVIFTSLFS